MLKVLNIHWGFSIGGVAQYASVIDNVKKHEEIVISTVCILNRKRHIDEKTLQKLKKISGK